MAMGGHSELNSSSLRKMLRPVHTAPDSPVTSPENTRGQAKVKKRYVAYSVGNLDIPFFLFCRRPWLVRLKKAK